MEMFQKCFGLSNDCKGILGSKIISGEFYDPSSHHGFLSFFFFFCITYFRLKYYLGIWEFVFEFLKRKVVQKFSLEFRSLGSDLKGHISLVWGP